MKQSSIEWLVKQLENHNGVTRAGFEKCIQQAKAMHKEEIENAFASGDDSDYLQEQEARMFAQVYYNETFNTEER